MTRHVMLDLETWGVSPGAAIASIGAVKFDPNGGGICPWQPPGEQSFDAPAEAFHQAIEMEDAVRYGLRLEPGTMQFWLNPERAAARAALDALPKVNLDEALLGFNAWLDNDEGDTLIWGNGANFDNVLLRTAYQVTRIDCPWRYHDDRCFRTIKNLA